MAARILSYECAKSAVSRRRPLRVDVERGLVALTDAPADFVVFRARARVGLLLRLVRVQLDIVLLAVLRGESRNEHTEFIRLVVAILASDGLL